MSSNCTTAYTKIETLKCLSGLDGQLHKILHTDERLSEREEQLRHSLHELTSMIDWNCDSGV